MDARLCLQVFDQANALIVMTPAGSKRLDTLTQQELSFLAGCKARTGHNMFAKKAMGLQEALLQLGARMDQEGIPHAAPTGAQRAVAAAPRPGGPAPPPAQTLALVPFVRTLPPQPPPPIASTWQPVMQYLSTQVTFSQNLAVLGKCVGVVVIWAPILMTLILGLYLILAIGYIIYDPTVVVRGIFFCADLVPNYGKYAAGAMMNQLKAELAERFR